MRQVCIAVAALVLLSAGLAPCQEDNVIQQWTFEQDTGGWVTLDPLGTLTRVTTDAYAGEGALAFTFPQRAPEANAPEGQMPGILAVPVTADASALQSVSLAVRTSSSTPLVIALNEEDKSSYLACVWSAGDQWHQVELALSDFHLSNDSSDENGRLDTEQINVIAIADAGMLVRMLTEKGLPFTAPPPGDMTIMLDDVRLDSSTPQAGTTTPDQKWVVIDLCDRPTLQWLPLGGEDVTLVSQAGDDGGRYLQVGYAAMPGTTFALLRSVGLGSLEGCNALSLQMRGYFDGEVVIALEQPGSVRFSATVQVQAGDQWQQIEIPFARFEPDRESGATGTVDPSSIRQVAIADIRALTDQLVSTNTWDIRNLVGMKP